jgi:hypothetical protein
MRSPELESSTDDQKNALNATAKSQELSDGAKRICKEIENMISTTSPPNVSAPQAQVKIESHAGYTKYTGDILDSQMVELQKEMKIGNVSKAPCSLNSIGHPFLSVWVHFLRQIRVRNTDEGWYGQDHGQAETATFRRNALGCEELQSVW